MSSIGKIAVCLHRFEEAEFHSSKTGGRPSVVSFTPPPASLAVNLSANYVTGQFAGGEGATSRSFLRSSVTVMDHCCPFSPLSHHSRYCSAGLISDEESLAPPRRPTAKCVQLFLQANDEREKTARNGPLLTSFERKKRMSKNSCGA